jgi:hypothetical protein
MNKGLVDRVDDWFYIAIFWAVYLLEKSDNKLLRSLLFLPAIIVVICTTLIPVGIAYVLFLIVMSAWSFGYEGRR